MLFISPALRSRCKIWAGDLDGRPSPTHCLAPVFPTGACYLTPKSVLSLSASHPSDSASMCWGRRVLHRVGADSVLIPGEGTASPVGHTVGLEREVPDLFQMTGTAWESPCPPSGPVSSSIFLRLNALQSPDSANGSIIHAPTTFLPLLPSWSKEAGHESYGFSQNCIGMRLNLELGLSMGGIQKGSGRHGWRYQRHQDVDVGICLHL